MRSRASLCATTDTALKSTSGDTLGIPSRPRIEEHMTALPAWRQRLAAVAVLMPHSFSVRLEPDDACWIRAPAAVMAVHESNFHAPCCEACGKEWGKTVPTAESDPFVMVLSKLHVQPAINTRLIILS